jgi:hypothetical protein
MAMVGYINSTYFFGHNEILGRRVG